jgi:hypothetical protein
MAVTNAFDRLCAHLESISQLDRLEVRGTIRIALKQAGLDPNFASPDQLSVVVEKIVPGELTSRAVEAAADLCSALAAGLKRDAGDAARTESPEAIFACLGRD